MKLETFFEKFDLLADAPGAVEKMRELVLQLAMRGQLVEQRVEEGDADALLASIEVARKRKTQRVTSEGGEAERPARVEGWHEVPVSWRWVRLSSLGEVVGGGTPRSDNAAFFAEDGIPWLTPADLNDFKGKRISRGRRCITRLGLDNSSAQLLPAGSVLFSSRAPIGYVAIAGTDMATNQGFKSCVPTILETNEFLYYYLLSAAPRIDREASGTTFREVSGRIVSQIPVPVPPLAEQKRIVAKVDELMALCDRLEAQQQEREARHAALARASLGRFAEVPTPANLEYLFRESSAITPSDFRKSILTLAVRGRLVRFDVDVEAQAVGDHIEFQNGYAFKSEWFKTSGTRLCRNANVMHGALDWRDSAYVDERVAKEFDRFSLSEGDIVLSLDRPLITTGLKVARVRESDLPCLLLQRVAKPVPKHDQIDMAYFMLWLTSPEFVDSINPGRSNGVPHISTRQVQRLAFILPPIQAQRRIVAKVDQLMAVVDELEAQLANSRETAAKLLEAVVCELTAGGERN